jgi:DNA polymerase V
METTALLLGPAAEIFLPLQVPLIEPPVPASAPGPPEEYREKRTDLNRLFHFGPSAFAWTAQGDSMIGAGIRSGDTLIVDRKFRPKIGDIVIADVNRQPTVKRLGMEGDKPFLLPENPNHKPIPIDPEEGTTIWGVVTGVYHNFRNL